MIEIKQIESTKQLRGASRWKINFTDGKKPMIVKGTIPFKIDDCIGMMVQIFKKRKYKKVLFGWPKRKNSITLKECHEWSQMFGFNVDRLSHGTHLWLSSGDRIVDKRKPGEPVDIIVTTKGDILSP